MGHATNDTKQRLIDTALELIWKSSYGSVSVDDICKAADVKKGSFYHFFPSKVDLAIAAMEANAADMKAYYDEIFSPSLNAVERFERLADYTIACQEEAIAELGQVCGCPLASLGSEMAGQEEGIRAKFDAICTRKERYYENALRDMIAEGLLPADTDVTVKAQEIDTYMLGLMTMARIQNDLAPVKRDLKAGIMRILGVGPKAQSAA